MLFVLHASRDETRFSPLVGVDYQRSKAAGGVNYSTPSTKGVRVSFGSPILFALASWANIVSPCHNASFSGEPRVLNRKLGCKSLWRKELHEYGANCIAGRDFELSTASLAGDCGGARAHRTAHPSHSGADFAFSRCPLRR